ncbi:Rpn family recombination-promoting nuclease/putative transposase [Sporosarcina sp.]|uniref:Rpn family recombination-promoting nuclease/putative transposase n=1 Tax=Sporosarcina sp. TaxID=49982 RepID=UPI0026085815|nr:Rpn family recombination-promoting nuclease/putative transposase [Sporosarcina sp.]
MAGNIEITSRIVKRIPLDRLMDLKVDYAFKQLFGNEPNQEITIVFLNAVLKRTGQDRITGISFTNLEAGGEYAEDKQSRLDLLVVTEKGEWINVEIQFNNQYDMVARSLFYWASVYRNQMRKKMAYRELNPVITVNLMNFNLFHQTDSFHTTFCLYEQEKRFRLTDMMEMHFVEMPKLIRAWKEGKLDPRDDVLARWLLLLGIVDQRNGEIYDDILKELEEIAMKDESLHQAFESWESLSRSPEEIYAYESRLKRILDEEAVVREAELRGEERGEKRGEKKGAEKGEKRTLRKMARYMLSNGIEAEKVAEETGLKLQEVLEIQAETHN